MSVVAANARRKLIVAQHNGDTLRMIRQRVAEAEVVYQDRFSLFLKREISGGFNAEVSVHNLVDGVTTDAPEWELRYQKLCRRLVLSDF